MKDKPGHLIFVAGYRLIQVIRGSETLPFPLIPQIRIAWRQFRTRAAAELQNPRIRPLVARQFGFVCFGFFFLALFLPFCTVDFRLILFYFVTSIFVILHAYYLLPITYYLYISTRLSRIATNSLLVIKSTQASRSRSSAELFLVGHPCPSPT